MAELIIPPSKDTTLRNTRSSLSAAWAGWKQNPSENHEMGGFTSNKLTEYRSFVKWDIDWSQVEQFTLAEAWFYTVADHTGFTTQKGGLKVARRTNDWSTQGAGGEGSFNGNVGGDDMAIDTKYLAYATVPTLVGSKVVLPLTEMMKAWAPKSVKDPSKKACLGLGNWGIHMMTSGSQPAIYDNEWVVASNDHPNSALHPALRLVYVPKGGPGLTFGDAPVGDVAPAPTLYFVGHYEPGRVGDHLSKVQVRVWPVPSGATPSWDSGVLVGGANDTATNTFSVPAPASLRSQTFYDWEARVTNQTVGDQTPWSAKLPFRKMSNPPALTARVPAVPSGSLPTMTGVTFQANYTDPDNNTLDRAQVQLRDTTTVGDPSWDDGGGYWDSGLTKVSPDESRDKVIRRLYQGPALGPGSYSYRIRAADGYDAVSNWVYGTFSLSQGYEPNPGDTNFLTGYDRRKQRFRIRCFAMGTNRAPGTIVAELYDAASVGASEYYNSPGEFFFTLPATHPQVAGIEPFQTHFSLELYRGEGWKPILTGIITDFDATEDEVVFYGSDYVGILALLSDERFNLANPELPVESGGAKYVDDTISSIIADQLNRAKSAANSPVGFIWVGDIVAMSEKVTIFTTFKERLAFISGLIDSHRAGTGLRTRLICQRNADSSFMWRVADVGIDRDNLRMEYGGIVQGFQVVPFGEWGTKVHGIGRTTEGSKPFYAIENAPGITESQWGAYPKVSVWSDLEDQNDLIRRTKQAAVKVGKVGKRVALGIRVDSLDIKDGWDIGDSFPLRIQRGVVDTTRYGSGYWTIWGWTWQSYPDGHTDTGLTILPREDGTPLRPDLIGSKPILSNKPIWHVGYGVPKQPPPPVVLVSAGKPVTTWLGSGSSDPSFHFSGSGAAATNGNLLDFTRIDSFANAAWTWQAGWDMDLGVPCHVNYIRLYLIQGVGAGNALPNPSIAAATTPHQWDGTLYWSNDGVSWTPAPVSYAVTGTGENLWGVWTLAAPSSHRYWRVETKFRSTSLEFIGYCGFAEWQVYGYAAAVGTLMAEDGPNEISALTTSPPNEDVDSFFYLDLDTGCVWQWDGDPTSPGYIGDDFSETYTLVYCPPTDGGGGGGTSPDRVWLPLTTIVGGVPELVWENNGLVPTEVPF